jgi:EmrB/QacA subfamily drug resistance transporter
VSSISTTGNRTHPHLILAVLALGGLAYAMLSSSVVPALPTMQRALHTNETGITWLLTGYLLSASVGTAILGRLGDMYGKERLLMIVLLMLALGTLISAIASSLWLMILGRVIQGAGGGIFPLAFSIIRDEFPRDRIAHGIALISAIMGIGGGAGIVLAGPIVQHFSYHWLFWFPLVAIAVATAGIVYFVPESPVRMPGRIAPLGGLLLAAWLVALLVAVSEGPAWGWASARVLGLFVASAVLLVGWVRTESRSDAPLVDMTMMRIPTVWMTNLAALVFGFAMFASFVLVPEFVELPKSTGFGFGASVTQAGIYMLPSAAGMLLAGPVAGRMSTTVGSRLPLQLGGLVSCAAFVLLAVAHSTGWEIYVAMLIMGIGIGLAFGSMANLIVEAVPSHQTGVATGMNTIVRSIGGAIGSQVAGAMIVATLSHGVPTEGGFTAAFAAAAAALAVGVAVALRIPARTTLTEARSAL